MKFPKPKTWLFAIAIININGIYSQDSIPLGLRQAIDLALQKNTEVLTAEYGVSISEFSLKEAKGNLLPKLYMTANYNRNIDRQVIFIPEGFGSGGPVQLGFDNDYRTALNLTFPIFSKTNFANKHLAEIQLKYQKEVARGTQQSIANAVKKAYFNYLVAQEVVNVQQNRLLNAEQTVEDIQKRLLQGMLTEYDLTSAKVQVATAKSNLLEVRSNLVPLGNTLKLLLGMDGETNLKLTEPLKLIQQELVLDENAEDLLRQNSRLKQLEIDVERNQEQIKLARSAFYPTLDAIGNYNYLAQSDDFHVDYYDWINTSLVGLQIQFYLFNGTITRNKVEQAKIAKVISQEEKDYIEKEYRMRYKELVSQLDFSRQKVAVQKENMVLTEEALVLSKKRYQFGVGTFLEVNNAELTYTQARLGWIQAISDYKTAYYDYRLLIGKE